MNKLLLSLALTFAAFSVQAQISYPSVLKGLKFQAQDGSALIKFSFRAQSLFDYSNNFDGDDEEMKAMVRRARLKFGGYLLNPKYEYKVELGLSNRDIGNRKDEAQVNNASRIILDAVFKYHISDHSQLWFGQTKLPGNRERVISSMALQFVDRTNVNSKFNIDRDFGVQYRYKRNIGEVPLFLAAALSSGEGRNITIKNNGGLSYTGRVEIHPLGAFQKKGAYFSSDLKREDKARLAVGASYCFNQQTDRSQGQLGSFVTDSNGMVFNDLSSLFVDMIFKYQGWSVQSVYAKRDIASKVAGYTYGDGFAAQAGYLFKNNMELSARYTTVSLAEEMGAAEITEEYTIGFSNYIVDHKIKWQTDFALINENDYRFRFQVEFGI